MPRKPDVRIERAKQMYLEGKKLIEIASQLDLPEGTVRRWKCTHKWDSENNERSNKKKRTFAKGKNPNSHHNGTGPPGNKNAEKHGFFSKWLPEETKQIIEEMPDNSLDLLWTNIQLQIAAIVRAQKLMWVEDIDDETKDISFSGDGGTGYTIQKAWDKQANFISAQSRAMKTLESMINKYDELVHKNWNLATDEQKARIDLLQAQKKKLDVDQNSEGIEKVVIVDDIPDPRRIK